MNFRIEFEQEEDGRWIAEVVDIPSVLAYGKSREEAMLKAQALALRVLAESKRRGRRFPSPWVRLR